MVNPESDSEGIISGENEILAELRSAKENGTLLGIWSSRNGGQMLMCQVESIYLDQKTKDAGFLLRERTLNGASLQTQYLYLSEIARVHRFKKLDERQSEP